MLNIFERLYKPSFTFELVSKEANVDDNNSSSDTAKSSASLIVNSSFMQKQLKYRFSFVVLEYNPHASDYDI